MDKSYCAALYMYMYFDLINKVIHLKYITQIYSGITSGRVLDGKLLYTKIL